MKELDPYRPLLKKITKQGYQAYFVGGCVRNAYFKKKINDIDIATDAPIEKVMEIFQSRISGDKWLDPYTDIEIDNLAKNGVKKIAVVTPSFVSDCLETLEEIGIRAKEDFISNGGEDLLAIPCMNEDELWVEALQTWIEEWKK